jgi:hypothetical protein
VSIRVLSKPPTREPAPGSQHPHQRQSFVLLLIVFVLALSVRLFQIKRSYNIFVDEITYSEIGRSFGTGHGLSLYGRPFNLHPPAVFALLGGVIRATGIQGATPDLLVLDLRPVMAIFGAGITAAAFAVSRRCGLSTRWAIVPTVIIALDPFQLFYDSRVMLEAVAQFFCIGAIASLVVVMAAQRNGGRSSRSNRRVLIAGGLSAGCAFSTKETFGLVLGVTLLLVAISPALRARRPAFVILGIGVLCYLAVTILIWSTSGFEPWWRAHSTGFGRLVGSNQITGFNASSTKVSLSSRLVARITDYAGTYTVLVLGSLLAVVQLWKRQPWSAAASKVTGARAWDVVNVWTLSSIAYLGYATVFGSLEEQMYYISLTPCALSLGLGCHWFATGWVRQARLSRLLSRGIATLCLALIAFDCFTWFHLHTDDNNSYAQFFAWERINVTAGSRIGLAEDVGTFVITNATTGPWTSLMALRQHGADFALVDSKLVDQGYSKMSPQTFALLKDKASVVFSAHSHQDGTLYLFDVRRLTS